MDEIIVIRSWHDSTHGHVFLTKNGDYCWKNGEKCLDAGKLKALITDLVHQSAALHWLASQTEKPRETPTVSEGSNHLDYTRYFRIPSGETRPDGPSVPWMSYFDRRPEWWGEAERVTIAGITWQRAQDELSIGPDLDSDPEPDHKPSKGKKQEQL